MNKHLKYILLLLVFLGTLKQSIAQTTISSSVTLTQTVLDSYTWPVIINGGTSGSPLIVTLGEDVTLSNSQNYFVINGEYVTIDGNGKTITLASNVSYYSGLIQNGNSNADGFNNLTVQNLGVLSNNLSGFYAGWIGQEHFSKNASSNLVINCYSTGNINNYGGGIIGSNSSGSAIQCYSTGNIGYNSGGIFGQNSSSCTANNCYAGGIYYTNDGIFGNNVTNETKINCYAANGNFNTSTANSNLTGTDGTVWNTSITPYTLSAFNIITYNNLGLVDTRPTSAAYSLRLLYPNYTGPLARININGSFYDIYPDNSSGKIFSLNSTISNSYNSYNATETGATSNLLSSIVSANTTANVAIWYDQTGNNANAEQSSTNAQPRVINAGTIDNTNGYPAITFQNTNQYLQYSNNLTVQTINTVRAVPNVDWHTLVAMPANTDFSVRGANGNIYNIIPNANDWSLGTSPNNTWINGNQNVNFTANNLHTAFIAAQNPRTSNMSISSTFLNRGMYNGAAINEIVLFPDNLTSTERTTIENNQSTEYTIGLITSDISPSFQSHVLNGTPTDLSISSSISNATFQWYSNTSSSYIGSSLINGATNNTYTPSTVNEGTLYYYVKVTANNKNVSSSIASIRTGIEITSQPSTNDQNVYIGNTVTPLSIQVTGSNITYQWYENNISDNSNGTLILGANSSTYTPPNSIAVQKYFYCKVEGFNTTIISDVSGYVNIIAPNTGVGSIVYSSNSNEYVYELISDNIGNIYFLNVDNSSGNNLYTIKKLDTYGTVTTISTLTSNANSNYFQAYGLKRDNYGNFYYQTYEYNNNSQMVSINKINANGSLTVLETKFNAYYNGLVIDMAGNLYYILNENSNNYINKIDANGNLSTLFTSSGNNVGLNSLKIDLQGNFYFIKYEYSSNSSLNTIVKADPSFNMVDLASLISSNSSSYYIGRNINNYEIMSSGEIQFIQQNYYYNQSTQTQTQSIQVKKIDSYGIINILYNDSVSNNNNYLYIENSCKDNLDNLFYIKSSYSAGQNKISINQLDNLGNNILLSNNYNTWISSVVSDNLGSIYFSIPDLHQIIKLPTGNSIIIYKWGLSPNGLKTQDNTIQLDINGKKGTSSPVNENGKVN